VPRSHIADSSALVALLSKGDEHHDWMAAQADVLPWPWLTCEAALTEAFHLLGGRGSPKLKELLRRKAIEPQFALGDQLSRVLALMDKYADVPMSSTDACLVRMSEIVPEPVVITTDADFRVYRRFSRQIVPCLLP
jgi:hypothetical protein